MKKIITAEGAPPAIGPYNHACEANGLIFLSGQIAIDPASGELKNETLEAETHQVFKNIGAVLEACGLDYSAILKCTVFLKDMGRYADVNAIYATYFKEESAPARELVEVSDLPKHVNIEISVIATR